MAVPKSAFSVASGSLPALLGRAAVIVLCLSSPAAAQTNRYWAPASGAGGSGTWNDSDLFWAPNADGSGTKVAWDSALTDNRAYFDGTAGTVTTGTAVSTNQIRFDTTDYLLAGSGTISLNGTSPQVLLADGVTAQISASLSGTGGQTLTFGGSGATGGTLTLSGTTTNNSTGVFTAGEAVIASGGSFRGNNFAIGTGTSATSTVRVKSGGSFTASTTAVGSTLGSNTRPMAAFVQEGGTVSIAGNLAMSAWSGATSTYTGSSSYTMQGGSLNLTQDSTNSFLQIARNAPATFTQSGGSVTVTRSNNAGLIVGVYGNGSYTLTSGTLRVAGTGAGAGVVIGGSGGSGTLTIDGPSAVVRIGGGGGQGGGRILLSASNGATAAVNLQQGDLLVNNLIRGNASVSANVNFSGGTLRPLDVNAVFGSATADNNFNITLSGTAATISGLDVGSVARRVDVYANLVGAGGVTFSGGTINLFGANTYGGNTQIGAGTLALGTSGSFEATSFVAVAQNAVLDLTSKTSGFSFGSGQTLAGSGQVSLGASRNLTILGALAPGQSPGTLSIDGNLVLGAESASLFEIDGVASGEYDIVREAGGNRTATFSGTLSLTFAEGWSTPTTLTLFDFSSYAGDFSQVQATGLANGYSASFNAATGQVNVVLVPEPGAVTLAGVGVALAGWVARRRQSPR